MKKPMTQEQLKQLARLLDKYSDKLSEEKETIAVHRVLEVRRWVVEDLK